MALKMISHGIIFLKTNPSFMRRAYGLLPSPFQMYNKKLFLLQVKLTTNTIYHTLRALVVHFNMTKLLFVLAALAFYVQAAKQDQVIQAP